ncbi:MAG: hypothetical protein JWM62_864 [Frankiales bacterium]|nr:hypothetical protein [Frankiales bacterium]
MSQQALGAPAVTGMPMRFLRWEGLVLFAGSLAVFVGGLDEAWWLVPLLLFVPDVAIVGYARSHRTGALAYDLAHSYPAPAVLGALAVLIDSKVGQGVALIWFAHIGMDRALGYGLKYVTGFHDTHLGRIGLKGHGGNATAVGEQPTLPARASVGGNR